MNHLEQSNAAFAEDLLQKSAVIQHYFMTNRAGEELNIEFIAGPSAKHLFHLNSKQPTDAMLQVCIARMTAYM